MHRIPEAAQTDLTMSTQAWVAVGFGVTVHSEFGQSVSRALQGTQNPLPHQHKTPIYAMREPATYSARIRICFAQYSRPWNPGDPRVVLSN